jgi:hypothetical protein
VKKDSVMMPKTREMRTSAKALHPKRYTAAKTRGASAVQTYIIGFCIRIFFSGM